MGGQTLQDLAAVRTSESEASCAYLLDNGGSTGTASPTENTTDSIATLPCVYVISPQTKIIASTDYDTPHEGRRSKHSKHPAAGESRLVGESNTLHALFAPLVWPELRRHVLSRATKWKSIEGLLFSVHTATCRRWVDSIRKTLDFASPSHLQVYFDVRIPRYDPPQYWKLS